MTIGGEIFLLAYLALVWRFKQLVASLSGLTRLTLAVKFTFLGLITALLVECFYYIASSSSISLFVFLLRPLIWYIGWYLLWWWLIKTYKYSKKELFFLAGVNGYIVEGALLKQVPIFSGIGIFLYPLIASVYGILILTPLIPFEEEVELRKAKTQVSWSRKYLLGLLPLLAMLPGVVWLALVEQILLPK